jgi:hypothetical protein
VKHGSPVGIRDAAFSPPSSGGDAFSPRVSSFGAANWAPSSTRQASEQPFAKKSAFLSKMDNLPYFDGPRRQQLSWARAAAWVRSGA